MKWLRVCAVLMIVMSSVFFASSSDTHVINPEHKKLTIDFTKDFERLAILQEKFKNSNSAVDKFQYSAAMISYTERILERLQEVNDVYYVPAMLILTGEIPDPNQKERN